MSRPKLQIDWKKVDHMLEAHCTGTQVAAHLGIYCETLYERVKKEYGCGFSEYSRQKKEKGNSSIKVTQYQQALKGDKGMLIWLGKNWLGQKDEPREEKQFDGQLSVLLDKLQKIQRPEEFKKNDAPKKK